ncbi:MAG: AGE family epimerase/isomerase [Janthinobacterium lividum]
MTVSPFVFDPQSVEAAATLRRHYETVILPMWRAQGFNPALSLPYDALCADGPPRRHRAMACARQLYVFSVAGDRQHADRLFGGLEDRFVDAGHGGVYYSVDGDSDGQPLETDKDLYTHAFIIFACAVYYERFGEARAKRLIDHTSDVIDASFARDTLTGLPHAAMSRDFKDVRTPPRQNPLMHLTEAYLAAWQATGESRFDDALSQLLRGMADHFVDARSGCVMELACAQADNWIEPGHQFEWFYLCRHGAHPAFAATGLDAALTRAFRFAQEFGVDDATGGVAAALAPSGLMQDDSQRIWAQTEYLRALACHPDASQRARLGAQIAHYRQRFLHAGGWHECLSAQGVVIRHDMPSTTAYHLASSYAALP